MAIATIRFYMLISILDAIHYNLRDNGVIVKKVVYIALDYNREGFKEVLGM
ncbi:MAG: transposase [Gudongella sp.]|nr:transposase [Gudongella sp.]